MREYELDSAFDMVVRRMSLRRPQLAALRKFHEAMKRLPRKLSEIEPSEAYGYFREVFPEFPAAGRLELTCALATGVGKTRLIGAFIAYLYLAEEAERFLILAPRRTIVDKLVRESSPSHPKYLFVDDLLVGEPAVIHSGNVGSYNPNQKRLHDGPEVWIFSPQAIVGGENRKFRERSEFLGQSPSEYISKGRGLVAFFDESHYLGDDIEGRGAWMQALRELAPDVLLETTGSPLPNVNILHKYDIKEALQEGLYIKDVEIFPKQRPTGLSDDEWDRVTIRDGLKRLRIKEEAINRRREEHGFEQVKPVMLVCAESQEHADAITPWIQDQLAKGERAIAVHSGRNEDQYIEELLKVETNDVKVVVHVFKLTEGWDVSNVYVIAALRALATVRGVIQTMGRGLRLPYGARINDDEVDSLDLLCYGSEASQSIVDELINNGFGADGPGRSVIGVRTDPDESQSAKPTKELLYPALTEASVQLYPATLKALKPDLSQINLPKGQPERMRSIGLRNLQIRERSDNSAGIDRERFKSIVIDGVLKLCRNLGGLSHRQSLSGVIDRMLRQADLENDAFIPIDIDIAIRQIAELIKFTTKQLEPEYVLGDLVETYRVGDSKLRVPHDFSQTYSSSQIDSSRWEKSKHSGVPISGWQKCVTEAAPFDSAGELSAAKALDRSDTVSWWSRNLPGAFSISTPAGNYSPDFLFAGNFAGGNQILLEIKGEFLAVGDQSEANIKAKAAKTWCAAMTAQGSPWQYWLVLDREAKTCQTIEDLRMAAGA